MVWPFKRKSKTRTFSVADVVPKNWDTASNLMSKKYPALDRHFKLTEELQNTYTPSSDKAVQKGVAICREMIRISGDVKAAFEQKDKDWAKVSDLYGHGKHESRGLPQHMGYKQLAIIYEKQGKFQEAIEVAKKAQQQGWNGDWEKRVARCEAKIAKQAPQA